MPATGRPEESVTRPSTNAGGYFAIRSDAAVGFGAVAHPAAATTMIAGSNLHPRFTFVCPLPIFDYVIIPE
jgi:hypothetical protein